MADVTSQKGALVGDKAVQGVDSPVEVNVVDEQQNAQVAPEREAAPDKVDVHETVVHTDEVITDPSDPRAVQVPDAGVGSLDLPIHALTEGTPEEKLAPKAKSPAKSDKS